MLPTNISELQKSPRCPVTLSLRISSLCTTYGIHKHPLQIDMDEYIVWNELQSDLDFGKSSISRKKLG